MVYKIDFPTNTSFNFIHLVNNVRYKFHILYNSYDNTYYMDIDKFENGAYKNILNTIKITTGIDILLQYKYYDLGSMYIVPATSNIYKNEPSAETLKDNYFILWEHN